MRWLFHCESVRGPLIRHGGRAGCLRRRYLPCQATVPGHWLRYRLRHEGRCYRRCYRLRYRRCYRRCYEWLRMTPTGRVIRECRMQFPRHRVAPRIHIVGIATFVDAVESSFNRIACETASRMCACTHAGPMARTRARHFARGPDTSSVGPTLRAWARHFERGPDTWRVGPMVCVWAAPRRISRG